MSCQDSQCLEHWLSLSGTWCVPHQVNIVVLHLLGRAPRLCRRQIRAGPRQRVELSEPPQSDPTNSYLLKDGWHVGNTDDERHPKTEVHHQNNTRTLVYPNTRVSKIHKFGGPPSSSTFWMFCVMDASLRPWVYVIKSCPPN